MHEFIKRVKRKYILADYAKWKKGSWVHYSKFPTLKINPEPFHMDPAGVYLFPEAFKTEGSWDKYPYKFIVTLPDDLKVLDLSSLNTPESSLRFLDDLKVTDGEEFERFKEQIEQDSHPIDRAWEYLQRYFGAGVGQKRPGSFNKRLRSLGYEAIFDDTGAIHVSEVQLLILDSRRLSWKRIDKKGSGYKIVKDIYAMILTEAKKYGEVAVSKEPKKVWSGWDRENQIMAKLKVWSGGDERDSDKYVYIDIYASPDVSNSGKKFKDIKEMMRANLPVSTIIVNAGTSKPNLEKAPWSLKKSYKEDVANFKLEDVKNMIDKVFEYIFEAK
jgi:hypothetical protein